MKRNLLLMLLGSFAFSCTMGQAIELSGFYGYMVNTDLKTYYGTYRIYDNPNYGGILSVELAPGMFGELIYNRSDTRFNYIYNNQTEPMDIATEYYQVGGLSSMGSGSVQPFAAMTLGAARFYLKESYGDLYEGSAWSFAGTLGLGTKIFLNDILGIRLQARMGLPMRLNGLYIGTGGAGTSFVVPVWQFDFSAGLILRLGA
jgi:hypothetical protein